MSSGVGRARGALLTASFLESCSIHSPSGHCPPGRAGRWGHEVPGALLLYLTQVRGRMHRGGVGGRGGDQGWELHVGPGDRVGSGNSSACCPLVRLVLEMGRCPHL